MYDCSLFYKYCIVQTMRKIFIIGAGVILIVTGYLLFSNKNTYTGKTFSSGTIVAMGDSLTFGPEVGAQENYPAQLEKLIHEKGYWNFKVINKGVNGDTVSDGLARVNQIVDLHPDIAIVVLGGNDFLRGLSPANAHRDMNMLVQQLQSAGITVILGGMRAIGPQVSISYKETFNALYSEVAEKYNVLLVPDFLAGVRLHSQYNLADKIHPNAEGYKIIVEKNIWPILRQVLRK